MKQQASHLALLMIWLLTLVLLIKQCRQTNEAIKIGFEVVGHAKYFQHQADSLEKELEKSQADSQFIYLDWPGMKDTTIIVTQQIAKHD
jgi:hypothetical protein